MADAASRYRNDSSGPNMSKKCKRGTAHTRLYRPGFYASSPAWCRAQNDLAQESGRLIPYPNTKEPSDAGN